MHTVKDVARSGPLRIYIGPGPDIFSLGYKIGPHHAYGTKKIPEFGPMGTGSAWPSPRATMRDYLALYYIYIYIKETRKLAEICEFGGCVGLRET